VDKLTKQTAPPQDRRRNLRNGGAGFKPSARAAISQADRDVACRVVRLDSDPFRKTYPKPRIEREVNPVIHAQRRPDLCFVLLDCRL